MDRNLNICRFLEEPFRIYAVVYADYAHVVWNLKAKAVTGFIEGDQHLVDIKDAGCEV